MPRVREVRRRTAGSLQHRLHVCGTGIGYKRTKGALTKTLCVVVLVDEKVPLSKLTKRDRIPQFLHGIPTDVVEIGHLRLLSGLGTEKRSSVTINRKAFHRPAQPGMSIAHEGVSAGTFGAVVRDEKTGELLILSNNHVLANSSNGHDGRAKPGDIILQPGPYDGGKAPADVIGHLDRFVPLHSLEEAPSCPIASGLMNSVNAFMGLILPRYRVQFVRRRDEGNEVDAAVAKPISREAISTDILGLGKVRGRGDVELEQKVLMSGRTSGVVQGTVMVLEAEVNVALGLGRMARFVNQVVTTRMAEPGDSGSLLVNQKMQAVGLVFAGSERVSLAAPSARVETLLGVRF